MEDILRGHPHLAREGILAALDYAAEALENKCVLPLEAEWGFLRKRLAGHGYEASLAFTHDLRQAVGYSLRGRAQGRVPPCA
ncbi:MAG: hypothetical protein ABDI20_06825 [Candidatus Bipolaricaulaceae bacterium]